jgi:hypothetical protein
VEGAPAFSARTGVWLGLDEDRLATATSIAILTKMPDERKLI